MTIKLLDLGTARENVRSSELGNFVVLQLIIIFYKVTNDNSRNTDNYSILHAYIIFPCTNSLDLYNNRGSKNIFTEGRRSLTQNEVDGFV